MRFTDPNIKGWSESVTVPVMGGSLRFRGLPITWDLDIEKEMPSPPDEDEKAVDRHNRLTMVLMVYDCLEPGQIEFDTIREDYDSLADFAESLNRELAGAGCRAPELMLIANAIRGISDITDDAVEEARADFLDRTDILNPDLPTSASVNG